MRVTSAPVSASSLAASAASRALNEPVRIEPANTRIFGTDIGGPNSSAFPSPARSRPSLRGGQAPSPPEVVRRGAGAFSFPFPSHREGVERRLALRLHRPLVEGPTCFCEPRRPPALHCGFSH